MALRDVKNFRFLYKALEYKYLHPQASGYLGLDYDPHIYKLFYDTLTFIQQTAHVDLRDYLNIKDPKVLEKFYKGLAIDIRLRFLSKPESVATDARYILTDEYYQQYPQDSEAEKEVLGAQTSSTASSESQQPGIGFPFPAGLSGQRIPRRVVYIAPQTKTPQAKLYVADKSGRVVEERTITPTSTIVKKPETPSVSEHPLGGKTIKAAEQPKLVVAEAPSKQIFIADKSGAIKGIHNIKSPSWLKTFGSNTQIFTKKAVNRLASGLTNFLKGAGGAGGGLLGGLAGTGGRFLGGAGIGGLNSLVSFSNQISRGSIIKGPPGKFWLILLGVFLLVGTIAAISPTGQPTPTAQAGPVGPINLLSCQLTRSDQTPIQGSIKSSILVRLFQEAELTTTVPAAVLAGIARLENPNFVINADDNHDAFYDRNFTDLTTCTPHFGMSPTGALGLMQLQPPGTTGSFPSGLEQGAKFLNKTLQEVNYCNVRENIFLAAGFILKKLQGYNIGDGTRWDPAWTNDQNVIYKVAESFYGCLPYGGSNPTKCEGPYSYGQDLWASIQSCQSIASQPLGCPAIGTITGPYGYNIPDYNYQNEGCTPLQNCHNGIDIGASLGDTLVSTIEGIVTEIGDNHPQRGDYIQISNQSSALVITYEHMLDISVQKGEQIQRGQKVGTVGEGGEGVSGPHLHYKIQKNGNLLNPFKYLGDSSPPLPSHTLASSDNLADNDYANVPITPEIRDNWGQCNKSP
ncbi:M23 family metallopeptidase [Candidatus Microgenomates bacterium]|nr:M23 family metallopeptidase [Candidatus Microgenomates bacterium]